LRRSAAHGEGGLPSRPEHNRGGATSARFCAIKAHARARARPISAGSPWASSSDVVASHQARQRPGRLVQRDFLCVQRHPVPVEQLRDATDRPVYRGKVVVLIDDPQ
jgi:hypothetical protein